MKSIFKKVEAQANFPKMEEEILKYWEMENIFEKSVAGARGSHAIVLTMDHLLQLDAALWTISASRIY